MNDSRQSPSVLQIGKRLLVTIPAEPSDGYLDLLQTEVLSALDGRRFAGVVLDVGAVEVMDSFFARAISEMGDMVRLMGGEAVVTGLQPAVALTLTELGLDLGRVRTAVDVEAALDSLASTTDRSP